MTSWITLLNCSSGETGMNSSLTPVSASQIDCSVGPSGGQGLVKWPMAPSVIRMLSFSGALPSAFSLRMPSTARPSDMVSLYW